MVSVCTGDDGGGTDLDLVIVLLAGRAKHVAIRALADDARHVAEGEEARQREGGRGVYPVLVVARTLP